MFRLAIVILLGAVSALAANRKLYLRDGDFHLVREYQVRGDRVRYFSIERADWEEIPIALVDLKRTESEAKRVEQTLIEDAKANDAEEKVEREQRAEIEKIPIEPGVFLIVGGELKTINAAESKVVNNKRRSVLKAMSPIPIIAGKGTVELDGERSATLTASDRPDFYIRLSQEERFGIVRLTPRKGARIVEQLTIIPVSKEIIEEQQVVETFRKQLDDGLYKIWPTKPLEPGEYAVVEYTEGKVNLQVWDFAYKPAGQAKR